MDTTFHKGGGVTGDDVPVKFTKAKAEGTVTTMSLIKWFDPFLISLVTVKRYGTGALVVTTCGLIDAVYARSVAALASTAIPRHASATVTIDVAIRFI